MTGTGTGTDESPSSGTVGGSRIQRFFGKPRWVVALWLMFTCLLVAAALLLVRITYEWITQRLSWETFDKYATSSTATAVGAIGAATIAATAVGLTLAHNKNVEANKTWWETFEWAAERAVPSKKEIEALPYRTSLDILSPLMDDDLRGWRFTKASKKSWALRTQACGSIVELVNQKYAAENLVEAPTDRAILNIRTSPVSDIESVKSFINSHPEARASRMLAATHFEELVLHQLKVFLRRDNSYEVTASPQELSARVSALAGNNVTYRIRPDALITRGEKAVAVDTKELSDYDNMQVANILKKTSQSAEQLGANSGVPTVLVTSYPIPEHVVRNSVISPYLHLVHWDGTKQDSYFVDMIKDLLR